MREALIYRYLHGAPMVLGIPVHLVLILATVGTLGALLVNQWSGAWAIAFAVGALGVGFVLHLVNAQDRIVLPLLRLRMRYRFQPRVSSFAPSYQQVESLEG
jgi:hypothetical protein